MTIKEFDLIEVTEDVGNVKKGMRGSVIDIHTNPNLAYEVEFNNEFGVPMAETALLPGQIKKLEISRDDYIKEGRARLQLMNQLKE
jgi:hypothetical protein